MPNYKPKQFDLHGFAFVVKLSLFLAVLFSVGHVAPIVYDNLQTKKQIAQNRINTIKRLTQERTLRNTASAYSPFTNENNTLFTIGFVGDIMLDRGIRSTVEKYGNGDYPYMFEEMGGKLSSFNILFGNLEGAMSNKGTNQKGLYSFNMDPSAAKTLHDVGFTILSTANNHAGDWGSDALTDTLKVLDKADIKHVGTGTTSASAYTPEIFTVNGTRVAFLALSDVYGMYTPPDDYSSPTMALLSTEQLITSIKDARQKADVVIVSIHFGEEYQKEPSERQKKYARLAIDSGASLVVGHHPHTVQPVEQYHGGYIAYSLGNFIFDQNFSDETKTGLLLKVTVHNKKIQSVKKETIRFSPTFQPYIDS